LAQNLTKGTGPTNSTLVDGNTNRISSFGYQYDQNGNMTNMPQQNAQMTYDSSNRMTRFSDLNDAESYQYAPDNKRVWRSKGCSYYNYSNGQNEPRPQIIFYSVFGQKMGEYCLMDNVTVLREYVYFGGRMVARTNGGGGSALESFRTDGLHSNQDAPGGGFFPFGETKSGGSTTGDSFATYSRDWHGADDANQRIFFSSVGRFVTPDPTEFNVAESRSQSWNKFSYVENDPINYVDPDGLARCWWVSTITDFTGTRYGFQCLSQGRTVSNHNIELQLNRPPEDWDQGPTIDYVKATFGKALDDVETERTLSKGYDALFGLTLRNFDSDCEQMLFDAFGFAPSTVQEAARSTTLFNGALSMALVSSLYAGRPALYGSAIAQYGLMSLADYFDDNPGTSAMAALNGNGIYLSPGAVQSYGSGFLEATLFHELLHNITGLTDDEIMAKLKISPIGGSRNITLHIITKCY
jgi:RHS repeat-associated protein